MTTKKTDSLSTLEQRLDALNQHKIDLGLERLLLVMQRLDLLNLSQKIITVGGTNGKGSTVAALSALLNTQKTSFGAFTSPHIHRFNERININGKLAEDEDILNVFAQIDQARAEVNLSYFEYAFLAAVMLFKQHDVDVMLLEVGLGGRLDAVNTLDADVSVITTVDIDHTTWLGDDIETIAKEKAGIMRADKPTVFGDANIPQSIVEHAEIIGADLFRLNADFTIEIHDHDFNYQFNQTKYLKLPHPKQSGKWQIYNFSSALSAALLSGYVFNEEQVKQALKTWHVKGRLETIQTAPLVLADVAHNQQSAQQLAQHLIDNPIKGQTRAVFSVLADKQVENWVSEFSEVIDHWFIFELVGERALDINDLKVTLADRVCLFSQFKSGKEAYDLALQCSAPNDRVIVFGSFHVLDEVFYEDQ